eukprot:6188032-Alexandrium_andersonii.AAC.1
MSGATQACTQARFKGKITWARLPEHERPPEWKEKGMQDPVVPLVLAIDGHPDAGVYWERHCEEHPKGVGFVPMTSRWPGRPRT